MYGYNLEDSSSALVKVVLLQQKACTGPPPALFMMSRTFVTRERRTGSELCNDYTAILHRIKTSPALRPYIHVPQLAIERHV